MLELLFTFLIGISGGLISTVAGGGGGLIKAPYFILIGIPPHVGLATARFGSIGTSISAIAKFRKTEHLRWNYVWYFTFLSVPAAVLGANLLLVTNDDLIRKIVGVVILIVAPLLLLNDIGLVRKKVSQVKQLLGYLFFFVVRTLQAAFGSGIGMFTNMVYMHFFGMTALEASATRRIPGLVGILITVVIFISEGVILYDHGLAILFGSFVGGYIGSHIAIKKGNPFVKKAFVIVLVFMAIKLFV